MSPAAAAPSAFATLRRAAWSHPEWWAWGLIAAAWAALILRTGQASTPHLCVAARPGDLFGPLNGVSVLARSGLWLRPLADWTVMAAAMMGPLALAPGRYAAFRSRWRRRDRAMAGVLIGFGAAWLLVGLAVVAWLSAASPLIAAHRGLAGAAGLLAAAAWQLSPAKAAALRACHRRAPLAPEGWRADADCLGLGWRQGGACAASCWLLMLCPMLAADSLAVMAAVSLVSLADRYPQRPPVRATAAALAASAGVWLLACAAGWA